MKRRVLRFERFLVWCFTMDRGERKPVKAIEANRGLGGNLLNAIAFPVRGSFWVKCYGHPSILQRAGQGGWNTVGSLEGLTIESVEDGSEYHCITPRDQTAKFWQRSVVVLHAGERYVPWNDSFVYVASGKLKGVDSKLISIKEAHALEAEEDSVLATMRCDDQAADERRRGEAGSPGEDQVELPESGRVARLLLEAAEAAKQSLLRVLRVLRR
jgi:hypothetical protein